MACRLHSPVTPSRLAFKPISRTDCARSATGWGSQRCEFLCVHISSSGTWKVAVLCSHTALGTTKWSRTAVCCRTASQAVAKCCTFQCRYQFITCTVGQKASGCTLLVTKQSAGGCVTSYCAAVVTGPAFWDFTQRGIDSRPLKMGPIGCPETSVINHHYSLRSNPDERNSQLFARKA
jgi:hypothetical protein